MAEGGGAVDDRAGGAVQAHADQDDAIPTGACGPFLVVAGVYIFARWVALGF